MKPTTKVQIEVDRLSKKLPDLNRTQIDWAKENILGFFYYATKKECTCLECNHKWNPNNPWSNKDWKEKVVNGKNIECPNCNRKIEQLPGRIRTNKYQDYFLQFTTIKNFQVIRIFYIQKYIKVGELPDTWMQEVVQHWIRDDGKLTIRSIRYNAMGWGDHKWGGGEMSIKKAKGYHYRDGKIIKGRKILPIIRRNGYKGKTYDLWPSYLFSTILSSAKAETLLKADQIELLSVFDSREEMIEKYWKSIKICIRNNYKPSDAKIWLDQLSLLEEFGKDILSTKYICPKDLMKEHNKLIEKKRKIQQKKELEELKGKIDKYNIYYKKNFNKYFSLKFSNDVLDIIVLDDVKEFYLEGNMLRHCVFQNKYFEREDSLILSARIGQERIETIEVNLKDLSIEQAHGIGHTTTKYRKQILSLIKSNIKEIKQVRDKKKESKRKLKIAS